MRIVIYCIRLYYKEFLFDTRFQSKKSSISSRFRFIFEETEKKLETLEV